jgi:hypothetical protein
MADALIGIERRMPDITDQFLDLIAPPHDRAARGASDQDKHPLPAAVAGAPRLNQDERLVT